jgi:hypothetical protein
MLLFGIRRNPGNGWEIGVNDPLASRRAWWPLGLVRHAAGRIAGRPKYVIGGIFRPGVIEVEEEVEPPDDDVVAESQPVAGGPEVPEQGAEILEAADEFPEGDASDPAVKSVDDIDDNESGIDDNTLFDPDDPDPELTDADFARVDQEVADE